jgi:hypothetical protein
MMLVFITALLAACASAIGLFAGGGPGPRSFTTLQGSQTELYGRGLYRNDTAFKAPIFRGTDAVFLFLGVPVLIIAALRARRGGPQRLLVLAGLLLCFLYNGISLTFGAAYNTLYLVYAALFATSFWALALTLRSLDMAELQSLVDADGPRKSTAAFLLLASLSPLVWLIEIVVGLGSGTAPASLGSYSTDVTTALDLGLITPACILAAIQVLRRRALGYILGILLLELLVLIGLAIIGQSAMQLMEGITLSPDQLAAFVLPFLVLSGLAIIFLRRLLGALRPRG